MSLHVESPVLTLMILYGMNLRGMVNCPQVRYNVSHTVGWCKSVPNGLCNSYMQMVMYNTGVVLKIPVQCICS